MRFSAAILLSLLAHAAVAALLVFYVECAPGPDALAQLDLTSVELSFADMEDDSAAAIPSLPSAAAEPEPERRPPEPERPPEVESPQKALPPDLEAMKLPDPEPAAAPMETPPPPEPPKQEHPPQEPEPQRPELEKPEPEKPKEMPRPAAAASSAPAAAPRQGRVDAPPSPRRNIRPDYPKGARQRGEQGDVLLEIVVSASGAVGDVRVASSSGFPELDEAAVRAVKAARFSPARRGGRPVSSSARITLTFRLK